MAEVRLEQVSKVFSNGTRALSRIDLAIADGEFMVLVGPSGCGKTTALRIVAGLDDATQGTVWIGDRVVNKLDPRARDIAVVFQSYALYPTMTVAENIGFGLRMRRVPKAEIRARVESIVRLLDLGDLIDRKPSALSGGQRQRVAMGRAIVRRPKAFLMDEPLSNLDAKLRAQMRSEIARLQREVGATTIYVTHDQVEAMTMGDRVAVMRKGELQQLGEPTQIYDEPANLFVASFIGSPSMSLVEGTIELEDDTVVCHIGSQKLTLPRRKGDSVRPYCGRRVGIGVRAENLQDPLHAPASYDGRIAGTVAAAEILGPEILVHLELDADPVVVPELFELADDGDGGTVEEPESEQRNRRARVIGRLARGSGATVGESFTAAVAVSGLHFFDLDTGARISTH